MRKCLVIGLDGATWDVLNPLIKSGHIPTLKKLMRKGVWGVLESTIPPYTGVAWTSFTTGCNAGKHGVFDFIKFDGKSHKMTVIKSDDVKAKTYFKYLEDKGYRNIIINLPGGFPPTDFSGIFVADFLAPDEKDIVRPKKLKLKYKEFKDYRIALKSHMFDHSRYLDEVLGIEEKRFLLAKKLFLKEKWDHFFLLFSGTDWASHSALGHFFSKKGSIRDKFIKLFVKIDSYIKWFSENMDEDTDLIIISDHGQTQKRKIFFMNEWLR
ncbi:MAG: alkaline phosphatase family protein, partial [Candidatus Aenigmatarchaeota archaeon]